jgi:hypothetical protein
MVVNTNVIYKQRVPSPNKRVPAMHVETATGAPERRRKATDYFYIPKGRFSKKLNKGNLLDVSVARDDVHECLPTFG